uniref:Uncharacterized protein n=1 Tax=viral metagenome TaxID=1070528 RepID=A0A6C0K5V1_9ZZZZ
MNSTITTDDKFAYHTFTNVEFSAYLVRWYMFDYYFFIKYGDKVYVDSYYAKDIVISFEELQKNHYLKLYYDLSLMLTKNKNQVIQEYSGHTALIGFETHYDSKRYWAVDAAFIDVNHNCRQKPIVIIDRDENIYDLKKLNRCPDISPYDLNNKMYNCYYKINPYDLENMKYSSQEELDEFNRLSNKIRDIRSDIRREYRYDTNYNGYTNQVVDYSIRVMEKELNELAAIYEDKKNVLNLAMLSKKDGINGDIIRVIYNHLVSPEENKRYLGIIDKIGYKSRLEINTMILEA